MSRTLVTATVLLLTVGTSSFAQSECSERCIPEWKQVHQFADHFRGYFIREFAACEDCHTWSGKRLFVLLSNLSKEDSFVYEWTIRRGLGRPFRWTDMRALAIYDDGRGKGLLLGGGTWRRDPLQRSRTVWQLDGLVWLPVSDMYLDFGYFPEGSKPARVEPKVNDIEMIDGTIFAVGWQKALPAPFGLVAAWDATVAKWKQFGGFLGKEAVRVTGYQSEIYVVTGQNLRRRDGLKWVIEAELAANITDMLVAGGCPDRS